ncbi:MAG: hypothetical protein JWN39_3345 [Ilumatobacteraceae bacterium]|nr:hypothetical protein [Ilumatobacteraceae bacterium]
MRRTLSFFAAALALVAAGSIGGLVVTSTGGAGAATSSPVGMIILTPGRVLDTRNAAGTTLPLNGSVVVNTGISGAAAVAVNITLTDTTGAGFITAWDGSQPRPGTSIMNSFGAGQNIANYAIVPVDAAGHFTLFTSNPANLIVDLMGYFPSTSAPVPSGLTAVITGYGPASTITSVTGTVSNGGGVSKNARVDIKCPNGTVQTDSFYALGAGQTKGFSVLCDQAFTSGATVQAVVEV